MFIVVFHFIIPLANSVWCLGGHTEEVVEKTRIFVFKCHHHFFGGTGC